MSTIVVAGMTRSGTTIFQKALATHRDLGFLHRLHGRFPRLTPLAAGRRLLRYPRLGKSLYGFDGWLTATETYRIFNRLHPRFQHFDLTESDVAEDDPERWQRFRRRVLAWQGESRWLLKFTGWARAGYMHTVFPDIHYFWVSRDPCDVGWSNYTFRWWRQIAQNNAVDLDDPAAALPFYAALSARLDGVGRTSLDRASIPWMHVEHRDLVEDPMGVLRRSAEFVGLDPDGFVTDYLDQLRIGDVSLQRRKAARGEREQRLLESGLSAADRLVLAPFHSDA